MALPRTLRGKDVIMIVVDRFSKMAHFIAFHKSDDPTYITNLFFQEIVRLHGILRTVVSDSNAKFLSHFWRSLWRLVGTKLLFYTTCHPQTVAKTEVRNRTPTTFLRGMVRKSLRGWDVKLAHAEFVDNRASSNATSHSPFEVCYGLNPLTSICLIPIPQEWRVNLRVKKEIKKWRSNMSNWGA